MNSGRIVLLLFVLFFTVLGCVSIWHHHEEGVTAILMALFITALAFYRPRNSNL